METGSFFEFQGHDCCMQPPESVYDTLLACYGHPGYRLLFTRDSALKQCIDRVVYQTAHLGQRYSTEDLRQVIEAPG